ncbi:PAAR domain-containing protein [Myxococcus faecalis]|uniref:PAAR domain-containing protein n=1 Tax=Myxococcus TaxID=32 RepID=UPI00114246E0|nr:MULTISPECIES: PAAR domain-containing protein [unclassified Myxococcus]MBZ4401613.1 PAAR domain-containing protein [Myxococcus sp. AS-1-15]MBZ4409338.1 PAAR domain-containing protein [Myxococcus sp. XM-1-1-1]
MSNPRASTSANSAVRDAQQPPQPAPPLMQPTGENVAVDSFASVVNRTTDPFRQAPPAHQGAVGAVNQALGGVLGLINAPVELLNTGFALATAPLAALFPALPAATLTALHVGLPHPHAHPPSLIPPAPPIPLPSIGTVLLSGCVSVLINGLPAARAGDVGLAVTCGSFMPPLEVFTGSSKVFIGGSRAARMGDITKHCTPSAGGMSKLAKVMAAAGMAAGALGVVTSAMDSAHSSAEAAAADSANAAAASAATAAGQAIGAAVAAAQLAADAAAMALSMMVGKDPGLIPDFGAIVLGQPNVLIGGFPMPSWSEVAGGLMKLVKGLRRGVRGGRKQGRLFCASCM